ncbi:Fic family protein [Flavobacterium nackdongense]|uniref:protein adenylyltransferase n=1 Tax=Flavobacterium nackdongense TaxID=2547394 RepID=A0A4P6YFW2_9FLAO|nr:Fic family protein [Flavobacterium nackdongense]QBN19420.1 winged helix-turn-helix transcriptional regulator [Flavobacterium nackdongense]
MDNFDEYVRQGEPNQAEKAKVWKTAIGLQQIDGLKPSDYLIETAKQNIEGDITIEEVKQRIDSYYKIHPSQTNDDRTEEADKVSARIAEMLGEQTFTFSPVEYLNIHRRLFRGIYKFAGKIRDYNITKQEWVLNGETVLYGSAESLKATLEYDFEQEKQFVYKGLSQQETIEHIAQFITYLWQIHVFGEGNTRTTALFLIKYLRTFGFTVNNELFEQYSWYFRNSLVRANYKNHTKGIHATNEFLLLFLGNLLLAEKNTLQNRQMHVQYIEPKNTLNDPVNEINDPVNKKNDPVKVSILQQLQQKSNANYAELAANVGCSVATIKRHIQELKKLGFIERIGSDKTGYWKIV